MNPRSGNRGMTHINSGRRFGKSNWFAEKLIENEVLKLLTERRTMSESTERMRGSSELLGSSFAAIAVDESASSEPAFRREYVAYGQEISARDARVLRASTPVRAAGADDLADALRHSVNTIYRDNLSISTAQDGARSYRFSTPYHAAVTLPRIELSRMANAENEYVAECTMAVAGKLNSMMVRHLVRDCELAELKTFKDEIIKRIREINSQGEDNDTRTI